jgi:hypothetical protein
MGCLMSDFLMSDVFCGTREARSVPPRETTVVFKNYGSLCRRVATLAQLKSKCLPHKNSPTLFLFVSYITPW